MLKKTVTYTDYNGVETTEDLYFNLSQAELIDMELSYEGGLAASIQKAVETQDTHSVMRLFKDIIIKSYGVKSLDGKRFIKSEEVVTAFKESEAYSVLITELLQNPKAAEEFMAGITPNVPQGAQKLPTYKPASAPMNAVGVYQSIPQTVPMDTSTFVSNPYGR